MKTKVRKIVQRTFTSREITSVVEYYHSKCYAVRVRSLTAIPEEGRWYSHNWNKRTEVILSEQTSFELYTGNDRYRVWIFDKGTQKWEPVMY